MKHLLSAAAGTLADCAWWLLIVYAVVLRVAFLAFLIIALSPLVVFEPRRTYREIADWDILPR